MTPTSLGQLCREADEVNSHTFFYIAHYDFTNDISFQCPAWYVVLGGWRRGMLLSPSVLNVLVNAPGDDHGHDGVVPRRDEHERETQAHPEERQRPARRDTVSVPYQ